MIGQENLINKINVLLPNYPKFTIITGPKGSGKKTLVDYICKQLKLPIVNFGVGIDDVRTIIERSYDEATQVCYVCADADNMSLGAKNALLKITEEPAENAYYILTLESMANTLETINSRATVLNLDNYSIEELIRYRQYRNYKDGFDTIVKDICSNTGEVDELFKSDVQQFYKFAQTVAYQIHVPTTGNIFKISKSVSSKDDNTGYNAILLFKTVRSLFIKKFLETKKPQYLYASTVTSECLRELALSNVNVVGTVDNWIMSVRTVLRGI